MYYFLKESGDIAIAVEGHTDSKGDDSYNMRLSQTRAESVKRYLTSMGIAAGELLPIGYGERGRLPSMRMDALTTQKEERSTDELRSALERVPLRRWKLRKSVFLRTFRSGLGSTRIA